MVKRILKTLNIEKVLRISVIWLQYNFLLLSLQKVLKPDLSILANVLIFLEFSRLLQKATFYSSYKPAWKAEMGRRY
jgi:hypothetical protein